MHSAIRPDFQVVNNSAIDGLSLHCRSCIDWVREKGKHQSKVVLVECGDFYETYAGDAVQLIDATVTCNHHSFPTKDGLLMWGFPTHAKTRIEAELRQKGVDYIFVERTNECCDPDVPSFDKTQSS